MEYPQNLNPLQARADTIRHDITCFGNNEFAGTRQPSWIPQSRIISQQVNTAVYALHHKPGRPRIVFGNVFCFLIQVL